MLNDKSSAPLFMLMHGIPSAGKSAFARQYAQKNRLAHINSDRLRFELFDDPQYSPSENRTVLRLADYMREQLMELKQPLIFDMSLPAMTMRRQMRQTAESAGYNFVLVWVQTDQMLAESRAAARDRRRPDDKYSHSIGRQQFEKMAASYGQPDTEREPVAVVSGQHAFVQQARFMDHHLRQLGYKPAQSPPKAAGRVDFARRQNLNRADHASRHG